MKTLTIGNLKSNFSKCIKDIQKGEDIIVEYGKKHEKIAVLVPYKNYIRKKRKVGLLEGRASYEIIGDFKISDEELFSDENNN